MGIIACCLVVMKQASANEATYAKNVLPLLDEDVELQWFVMGIAQGIQWRDVVSRKRGEYQAYCADKQIVFNRKLAKELVQVGIEKSANPDTIILHNAIYFGMQQMFPCK